MVRQTYNKISNVQTFCLNNAIYFDQSLKQAVCVFSIGVVCDTLILLLYFLWYYFSTSVFLLMGCGELKSKSRISSTNYFKKKSKKPVQNKMNRLKNYQ
jgi:hypothetical protein